MKLYEWHNINDLKPRHGSLCIFRRFIKYDDGFTTEDNYIGYFYWKSLCKDNELFKNFHIDNDYILVDEKVGGGSWSISFVENNKFDRFTKYEWIRIDVHERVNYGGDK